MSVVQPSLPDDCLFTPQDYRATLAAAGYSQGFVELSPSQLKQRCVCSDSHSSGHSRRSYLWVRGEIADTFHSLSARQSVQLGRNHGVLLDHVLE